MSAQARRIAVEQYAEGACIGAPQHGWKCPAEAPATPHKGGRCAPCDALWREHYRGQKASRKAAQRKEEILASLAAATNTGGRPYLDQGTHR